MLTVLDSGASQLMFTNRHVSDMLNQMDPVAQRLTAAGRFPAEGGVSAYVEIEKLGTTLRMIPAVEDGRPANRQTRAPGDAIILKIPSAPVITTITANAIRNIRAAGTLGPQRMAEAVNTELMKMRLQFDMTREYHRMTALKGVIKDGNNTTLYDLFETFGLAKKTIDFDLDNPATDVKAKCEEVVKWVEDKLVGDTFSEVRAEVDGQFFDKLTSHVNVEKFYIQHSAALELANAMRGIEGNFRPREFKFGGVHFIEYRAKVNFWDGTSARMIEPNMGHAYPFGTLMTEKAFVAPPIDITQLTGAPASTADLIHITQEILKHNEGVELKGQLNELPVFQRPEVLVELIA